MSSSHFLIGLFVFLILSCLSCHSFNGSGVENPPAMQEPQEMWVQFLGWKDPLEEEMATHSSILAWRIPWTEGSDWLQSMGLQIVRHDWIDLAHMYSEVTCNTDQGSFRNIMGRDVIRISSRDFLVVRDFMLPVQGIWVWSMSPELEPTCCN